MKRIIGYDLARAIAVFGMVVVNFKTVMCMGNDTPGWPWLVRLTGVLEGRAAATFVVLAGVGLSLASRKGRINHDRGRIALDRNRFLIRAAFLFSVGLMYTPIWPADILHYYGVYIAIGSLFIAAAARWVWLAGVAAMMMFLAMLFLLDYERGWDWETLEYAGFWSLTGMVRNLFFNGFHPVFPWVAFLFVGMLLGRVDLSDPRVRRRVIVWGAGVAVLTETLSWALVHSSMGEALGIPQDDWIYLIGTGPMPPVPLYLIAGSGTACAVIGLSVWVGERWGDSRFLRPIISTGQLALTLYVAHVVIGMGSLQVMGRLGGQMLPVSILASASFCVAGVVFAHVWRLYFKRGPLEAIIRALTQWPTQAHRPRGA